MRSAAVFAGLVAAANAYAYNTTQAVPEPVYTTKVVTDLTTVCPGPTEIPIGTKTYTVTEATTLTITDCPCTITEPVKPTEYPSAPAETPIYTPSAVPSAPAPVYPSGNGTVPQPPAGPTGTQPVAPPAGTTAAPPEFTGAATKMGASLLAVGGVLAAFL